MSDGTIIHVLAEIQVERSAQDQKWGEQNHPDLAPFLTVRCGADGEKADLDIVSRYYGVPTADRARETCEVEHKAGMGSWFSIHIEELGEALEAAVNGDTVALRTELVQLAATVTAHVQAMDRRALRERLDMELEGL